MKRIAGALAVLAACTGDIGSSSMHDASGDPDGTGNGTSDVPGGVGEPANLTGITLYHNQVRAAVDTSGIAAGPLPAMVWDADIAAHAQAWAAMCTDMDSVPGLVDHSSTAYRSNVAGYAYLGENVFGSGGSATAKQAVDTWASEKANFTYPTTCSGTCGHYTQVVWRTSTHLGCANVDCPSLTYGSTILCQYGPGGNDGSAPY